MVLLFGINPAAANVKCRMNCQPSFRRIVRRDSGRRADWREHNIVAIERAT